MRVLPTTYENSEKLIGILACSGEAAKCGGQSV